MNISSKIILPLLVLLASSLSLGACTTDSLGNSQNSIDGRPFFELFEGQDGDHYFNLAAANHEVVLSSEGYSSRSAALSGLLSVLDNSGDHDSYELREAVNAQHYFVLHASNGQTIGRSELYASASNAKRGVATTIDTAGDYLAFLATRTGERFSFFVGDNDLHYFNLIAENGEIVLSSQAYATEAAAMNGAFAVSETGLDSSNYDVKEAKNGEYYFNLKANNGEVIGTSEMYYSKSNARRARNSVIDLLPIVEIL